MTNADQLEALLVEDNPQDAELTIRALKKRNLDQNLKVVEDGADALDFIFGKGRYAQREGCPPPKAIFLDLKLPKVNGLEVLRALKANQRTRSIPVILLTSSRLDKDVRSAYELGVNSYVVKSLDSDTFQTEIGNIGFYWLRLNHVPA